MSPKFAEDFLKFVGGEVEGDVRHSELPNLSASLSFVLLRCDAFYMLVSMTIYVVTLPLLFDFFNLRLRKAIGVVASSTPATLTPFRSAAGHICYVCQVNTPPL
jgi:hypothetical protein